MTNYNCIWRKMCATPLHETAILLFLGLYGLDLSKVFSVWPLINTHWEAMAEKCVLTPSHSAAICSSRSLVALFFNFQHSSFPPLFGFQSVLSYPNCSFTFKYPILCKIPQNIYIFCQNRHIF